MKIIRREKRTKTVSVFTINKRVKMFLELLGVIVGIPLILLELAVGIPLWMTVIGYIVFGLGYLALTMEGMK